MIANPEPYYAIRDRDTKGAEAETDPDRPEFAGLFEMQGRMARILFQEFKVCVGKMPDRFRKSGVAVPETRGSMMSQRVLH